MPHGTEEEGKDGHSKRSYFNIASWWRKFHFSGRVIACSVLLGLGLVLIGGLIFAINLTDDSSNLNVDDSTAQIPTKAPANYTGPVVMGIGGFIVTIGVIMCLFETQVCRKRTGDSSPLITEKTDDPESKASDPTPGPSTSNGHKIHRHGARKTCASPKKSKSRHAKSRSKERNQQKNPSSKSPPVPVHPSQNFLTSSEDNFLTPPNTLDERATVVKIDDSGEVETKHSAVMKSFTNSETSWNQSTEFLTPSTSFRDSSVSLNNSVEMDKRHDKKNVKDTELSESIKPEYATPLTVEEDRIQQLLIRVKNEQKQMAGSKMETKVGSSANNNFGSSRIQIKTAKTGNEIGENFEIENKSMNELHPEIISASRNDNKEQTIRKESGHEISSNKYEINASEKNMNEVPNEAVNAISNNVINVAESKIPFPYDVQEDKISSQRDSTLLTHENKDHALASECEKSTGHGSVQGNDVQGDLESSGSSDETVVSPDNFQENSVNNGSSSEKATLPTLEENSVEESQCVSTSESPNIDSTSVDDYDDDHHNTQESVPHHEETGVQDLDLSNNDNVAVIADEIKIVSNDETS